MLVIPFNRWFSLKSRFNAEINVVHLCGDKQLMETAIINCICSLLSQLWTVILWLVHICQLLFLFVPRMVNYPPPNCTCPFGGYSVLMTLDSYTCLQVFLALFSASVNLSFQSILSSNLAYSFVTRPSNLVNITTNGTVKWFVSCRFQVHP